MVRTLVDTLLLQGTMESAQGPVRLRQRLLWLGHRLGLPLLMRTAVAAGAVELLREARRRGLRCTCRVTLEVANPAVLRVTVGPVTPGVGADLLQAGLMPVLSEAASLYEAEGGTVVRIELPLPTGAPPEADLQGLRSEGLEGAADEGGEAALQEVEDFATLVAALREARADARALSGELDETNRGVLALYAEVEQKAAALEELNATLEQRIASRTAQLRQRAGQLARLASELTLTEQRERRRLARILHDHLQQLLVGARLGLEVLTRRVNTEHQPALEQVQGLIQEAVDASRSLTVELSPPILHEAGLVAGLQWLVRWMRDKHQLEVHLTAEPDAEPQREDVRVLTFESVRELLFNVVKHGQTDRAWIDLVRNGDECLRLSVRDEGVGFDPELARRRAAGEAGGFGLFSIEERLAMLGGSLSIRSAPGTGSQFTISAPLRDTQATEATPACALATEEEAAAPALGAPAAAADGVIRVLLADDHVVMRQGLSLLLGDEPDIEIIAEASDGEEAVELARRLRPDVVLMDFSMPRMDGVEATRTIHGELPEIRIIGLSMYEEADRASAMRHAGAVAYLTKSGKPDVLLAAIRSAAAD